MDRILKASQGRSESGGGMNMKEIQELLKQYNIDPTGTRAVLNTKLADLYIKLQTPKPTNKQSAEKLKLQAQEAKKATVAKVTQLTSGNVMYYFAINKDDRPAVTETLQEIFLDSNIKNYIARGNLKTVYQYGETEVFKIILTTKDRLSWMLREPVFMLTSRYTNKPRDITIYVNRWSTGCPVTIRDAKLGDAAIITWREEKALYTDLDNFPPKFAEAGAVFIQDTEPVLQAAGFTDLGNVNIGYFNTIPHIRWIDVQPETEEGLC